MKGFSVREQNRYFVSIILALFLHIGFLILLQFVLNIKIEALPQYSGALEVAIGEERAIPVVKEEGKETETVVEDKKLPDREKTIDTSVVKENESMKKQQKTDEHIDKQDRVEESEKTKEAETTLPEQKEEKDSKENITDMKENEDTNESEPYDPGLKEGSLADLDRALTESKVTTPPGAEKDDGQKAGDAEGETTGDDGSGTTIKWEDNQDRPPLYRAKPDIPDWVSREGLHLTVVISFVLNPDGILTGFKVKKSSGYPEVDAAVVDALRRWKFPAVAGTKNVSGEITYYISPK
jgi:TonB family protein